MSYESRSFHRHLVCNHHKEGTAKEIYLMLTVGLCGSFTTFSTFASDFFRLNSAGQIGMALVYLAMSIIIGFLFFGLGRFVVVH